MDSYQQGVEQLRQMVGAERMQCIVDRFRSLSPASAGADFVGSAD